MPTNRKYSAIRMTFDCYFIDYWSGDRFIVYFNNQIMSDISPISIIKTPILYCGLPGGLDIADSKIEN